MMGAQGSSGTGTGSNANIYTPTAQPAADQMYQDTVRMLANAGFGPAGTNYPTGQSFVDQYITGSPYASQALQGAQITADQMGQFYPYQAGAGYSLLGAANNALPFANQAAQQAFNPLYQQIVDYTQANPYFQLALSGANQAADIGGQGASNLQSPIYRGIGAADPLLGGAPNAIQYGQSVYDAAAPIQGAAQSIYNQAAPIMGAAQSIYNQAAPIMDVARGVNQNAGSVWNAAQQVANTAFDPQQALKSRTERELLDQQGAINAMSGVSGTPYGAGVTGKTLSDFDINWQNNLLSRQQAGLGALGTGLGASQAGLGALGTGYGVLNQGLGALGTGYGVLNQGLGALGAGQRALGTGANAYNAGLGAYGGALGQYGNALTSGLGNLAGTANLGASSAALPGQTYQTQLNNILGSLKAQQAGAAVGTNAYSDLINAAGSAYGRGAGLQNNAVQQYLSGTQQPYNTGLGIANNALSGLSNVTNLGNQQYALPQEVLNALSAYLRLGQAASLGSGQLGELGFNQTAQGLGGLIGGANTLFGNNSLLGGSSGLFGNSGLLGGLGGLFGGGGAALDMAGVAQTAGGLGAATGLDAGTLALIGLI